MAHGKIDGDFRAREGARTIAIAMVWPWPFSKWFEEGHGAYTVRNVNGKSVLFRRVAGPKGSSAILYKELTFPTERLSKEQKERWRRSVADGEPMSVLTNRRLSPDGPTAAMFHVLAKRR